MRKVLNSRIFKIIYTVFVIIFVIFIGSFLAFNIIKGKSIFGYRLYTMPDNTMVNVYKKNDVLLVKNTDNSILELGDDIAYYGISDGLENRLIIHRIVRIDNSNAKDILFVTQGIKIALPDPVIHRKNIIGIVEGKVPILSELNQFLKTQIGFFILIVLPLILILVIEIFKTSILMDLEKNKPDLRKAQDRGKHEKENKE